MGKDLEELAGYLKIEVVNLDNFIEKLKNDEPACCFSFVTAICDATNPPVDVKGGTV